MKCRSLVFLLLGLAFWVGPAFGAFVESTGPNTYAVINPSGFPYEDPVIGTVFRYDTIVEWRDADFMDPGYKDWTTMDNGVDGNSQEVWLRHTLDALETITTVPGTVVGVHLVGDDNDGRADIYVDGVARATLDMYTASGVDRAYVCTENLNNTTHTIMVVAAGIGTGSGPDVAIYGASVLHDGTAPPPLPSVPALTSWGILLIGALIVLTGAYYVWRRGRLVAT